MNKNPELELATLRENRPRSDTETSEGVVLRRSRNSDMASVGNRESTRSEGVTFQMVPSYDNRSFVGDDNKSLDGHLTCDPDEFESEFNA